MRKLSFLFLGLMLWFAVGCTESQQESNNSTSNIIHDTVYVYTNHEVDEEFYNSFHPDSVDMTTPEGFTYYSDYEVHKYGRFYIQYAYALGVMLPLPSYPHSSQIARWLIQHIAEGQHISDNRQYQGNLYEGREIFDYMSDRFFNHVENEDCGVMYAYHDGMTMRVEYIAPRFITYRENTDSYGGGAHGMYTERYITFDPSSNKELKNQDLFRSECIDSIKNELFRVASYDSHYISAHGHQPGDDVSQMFYDYEGNFTLPQAALLENGVVFSFQPYDIECFAAGLFHFIIPYQNIEPYLTNQAKTIIPN